MNIHSLAREYPGSEISWQKQYKDSITDIGVLCDALDLTIDQLPFSHFAHQQFRLRVPWSYVKRMRKSDPNDPLLLQVLPHTDEKNEIPGYSKDPVGDLSSVKTPGLLKKYKGRALLIATSRCAVHCRYCFRRHFPYPSQNSNNDAWKDAIHILMQDTTINEVILSGGDPLVLQEHILTKLVRQLESIPHIKRLRIHTRLPIVIPARINTDLINLIRDIKLQVVLVLHINHAQEFNPELQSRLRDLATARCTLLNQSVLLKNINDNCKSLVSLSESLFQAGVLPYYLHLLDKVQGAAHFEVCESQARSIMREITAILPGYLVPKLVKEQTGLNSKTLVAF